MRAFLSLWLALSLAGGFPAAASGSTAVAMLKKAEGLARERRYEKAISTAQRLLDDYALETLEEILLAHRVLGASYCETGQTEKAREHFGALLAFSADETVADLLRTKPCEKLFAELKQERQQKQTAIQEVQAQPPVRGSLGLRYIPFGTGQFLNEEQGKGIAFAVVEGTMFATALAMAILFETEKAPDGTFPHATSAAVYRGMFWGCLGVGVAAGVWGVWDAVHVYHKRTKPAQALKVSWVGSGAVLTVPF